jgi:hypothetical protein
MAAMAEYERSLILERTRAGRMRALELRVQSGARPGQPIMGQMARTLALNSAAFMQRLADHVLPLVTGGLTLRAIARQLTEAGHKTFRIVYTSGKAVGGERLTPSYLYKVIRKAPALQLAWDRAVEARARRHEEAVRLQLLQAAPGRHRPDETEVAIQAARREARRRDLAEDRHAPRHRQMPGHIALGLRTKSAKAADQHPAWRPAHPQPRGEVGKARGEAVAAAWARRKRGLDGVKAEDPAPKKPRAPAAPRPTTRAGRAAVKRERDLSGLDTEVETDPAPKRARPS